MFGVLTTPQCVVSTKGHRAHVTHTTGCPQGWRPQDHGPTLAEGGQSAMVGRLGLPRMAVTPTPRSPKPRRCWVLLNRFATEGTAEHLLHDGHVPFPRGSSPGSSDQPAGKRSFSRDRVSAAAASSGLPWKTSPMPSASRARWSPVRPHPSGSVNSIRHGRPFPLFRKPPFGSQGTVITPPNTHQALPDPGTAPGPVLCEPSPRRTHHSLSLNHRRRADEPHIL